MRLKILLFSFLCLFIGTSVSAQSTSANTYDKDEVMASIQNLTAHTQTWINTNFDRLSNKVIKGYMDQSAVKGFGLKYGAGKLTNLKKRATSEEIEAFYGDPSESKLLALFDKYNVSY